MFSLAELLQITLTICPRARKWLVFYFFFSKFSGIGGDTPPNHPGLDNDKESQRYIVQKESLTTIISNIVFHYSFSSLKLQSFF